MKVNKADPVQKTVATYDAIAAEYARLQASIKPVKKQLDFFLQYLGGDQVVLDVGCGHGRESGYLAQKGCRVTGIDLSKNLLRIARKSYPQAKFKLMDMRRLKFTPESFNGLWVCTSFLHIPKTDAKNVLREFWRVLKPNGLLFLGVQGHPNERATLIKKFSFQERLIVTPEFGRNRPRFFAYYTLSEIKKLLKESGFKVFKVFSKKEKETKILWLDCFCQVEKN